MIERYAPFTLLAAGVVQPPEADPEPPPATGRPPVVRSLDALAWPFRHRVQTMLRELRTTHEPLVWETLRTQERGDWLKARGRSKNGNRSMHTLGAAVDVICMRHRWACSKHDCDFFAALGAAAKNAGLYWGGDWRSFVDKPHVQAVPVRQQNRLRRADDVPAFLEDYYA